MANGKPRCAAGSAKRDRVAGMDPGISTYLDLLRVAAAIEVFFYHFGYLAFHRMLPFAGFGHQAVIVFFVLSGYVIAYVAATREIDLASFAISRASRVYSVAIPALAASAAIGLYLAGRSSPPSAEHYQLVQPWKYVPLSLAFGNDWWFLNEDPYGNVPYWSLTYEVWYYALFAGWMFLRGGRRILVCGAVLLLVGPRSWLLLPTWLAGVAVYRINRRARWRQKTARVVWATTLLATALLLATGLYHAPSRLFYALAGEELRHWLRYSQYFLSDYVLAALIAMNLVAAASCKFTFGSLAKPIRWAAGVTFALYLFHYPLLEFYSLWLPPAVLALAVLLTCSGVGIATERLRRGLRASLVAMLASRSVRARSAEGTARS
jgi:peptidoglycan/LPS O-acetylase OafA/YrhL